MSSPDLTPPGPPIEPVTAPMPAAAQPYGQPQPAMPWGYGVPLPGRPPRAPRGLAIATLVLSCVLEAVLIGAAVASGSADQQLRDAAALGGPAPYTLFDALVLLLYVVGLPTYIVTCVWLMLARSFATKVRPGDEHARGEVWAWLGWWMPVVFLWFPYQVVRDIRRASLPLLAGTGFVMLWWVTWLLTVTGFRALTGAYATDRAGSVHSVHGGAVYVAVMGGVALAAWISVIRDVSRGQLDQEREFASQGRVTA